MNRYSTVLLLSTFYFLLLLPSCQPPELDTSSVIQDYFTPYPNEVVLVKKGAAPSTMAGQAMKLYEEGRYDQAIILFNELVQIEGSVEKRYSWIFYKGNAELAQNQYQKALTTFSYLPSDHPLYKDSRWYVSLIYLQLGQIKEAKKTLQQIPPTHQKYADVQSLIEDFDL